MRKYLFTILIVSFFSSCVPLEEERILLNEIGSLKGDSLEKVLVNPVEGIHYVFVDTAEKELLIRYEELVAGINFIPSLKNRLSEEQLLFVPILDSLVVVKADTNLIDSNIVSEQEVVEEIVENIIISVVEEEVYNDIFEKLIVQDSIVIDTSGK